MAKVHRRLFERLGSPAAPVPAAIIDTPYGFQENADELSARTLEFFATSVGSPVELRGPVGSGVRGPVGRTVVGSPGLGRAVEPAADYLPGEPLVLSVGYLIERKGLRELIAAAGLLRRRGRPFQLVLVGDGPLKSALEEQAAAEGVADSVHFLGRVPHARVLQLMARAQLFALPSWDEAFGLVYTEAMAQGTPRVAASSTTPPESVKQAREVASLPRNTR